MHKLYILLLLFGLIACATNQRKTTQLKNELINIRQSDQGLRKLFTNGISQDKRDSILKKLEISKNDFRNKGWELVKQNDSLNLIKVEKIIQQYGYPGQTLVGRELSSTAFLVIQHAPLEKMEEHYAILEQAYLDKELDAQYFAMFQDRILMYQGKEQVYGTQVAGRYRYNDKKDSYDFIYFIWPLQNPEKVNELRKKMNINSLVEDYANYMDIDDPFAYTIQEANEMKQSLPSL